MASTDHGPRHAPNGVTAVLAAPALVLVMLISGGCGGGKTGDQTQSSSASASSTASASAQVAPRADWTR
ncbi:MAG: hypothetical protein QOH60_5135 [Mycobacterium sp.]|jgi:hypothetical protein|nr:hypothetical protein [Mycobacterium sp.]